MHQFIVKEKYYAPKCADDFDEEFQKFDESKHTLEQIAPKVKSKFEYEYDFGDDWLHEVEVEKISPSETSKIKAVCIEGELACPPEDCGGIFGYYDNLKILGNQKHPDHKHIADWMPPHFDPSYFDLKPVNALIGKMRL